MLIPSIEIKQESFPVLLQLIISTYPYYCDRDSSQAVQRCIRYIFTSTTSPKFLESFIYTLNAETFKQGISPSNAYILTEWCGMILELTAGTELWPLWGLETTEAHARALELCMAKTPRRNVRRAALAASWRALQEILSKDSCGEILGEMIEKLCTKTLQPKLINAVMLGAIADMCARDSHGKEILESKRSHYYNFYAREIIGSRTYVPSHIAKSLNEFFSKFVEKDGLEREVVPALEKGLLRAPEIVLDDLVLSLIKSMPSSIDLSPILHKSLLKPLLSITKLTNPTTRLAALPVFKAAALKCHDSKTLSRISEEILAPLESGKLPSADQRAIYAEMVACLSGSEEAASEVSERFAAIANKETNEAALTSETHALLRYLIRASVHGEKINGNVITIFNRGVSEKKVSVKKIWITCVGELFWGIDTNLILSSKLDELALSVLPHLSLTWKDVVANPMAASQSGLITAAYVFVALSLLKLSKIPNTNINHKIEQEQIIDQTLTMEPKPSYLLNPRIYGKLTNDNDTKWFLRTLICLTPYVAALDSNSPAALAWSQALIFCICSSITPLDTRKDAIKELRTVFIDNPSQIGRVVIAGLWQWHISLEMGEKESAAIISKTGNNNLHRVIRSICLPASGKFNISEGVRKEQMILLFVLCRPELVLGTSWIDLCIRTGIDPGDLARSSSETLVGEIEKYSCFKEEVSVY